MAARTRRLSRPLSVRIALHVTRPIDPKVLAEAAEHQAVVDGFTEWASDVLFNDLTIMEPPSLEQEEWRHDCIDYFRKKRGDDGVDEQG
jgi:hypothetical protein